MTRRQSFLDPVVLAAALTGAAGGITGAVAAYIGNERQKAQFIFQAQSERCTRAFVYIGDESPNLDVPEPLRKERAERESAIAAECERSAGP
jgi:hypothetical protein